MQKEEVVAFGYIPALGRLIRWRFFWCDGCYARYATKAMDTKAKITIRNHYREGRICVTVLQDGIPSGRKYSIKIRAGHS